MPFQITKLKNLPSSQISDTNLLIVTQLTGSGNLPETKTIEVGQYKKYAITSSNITTNFYTGSFSGNFYGTHFGLSDTSSYSQTSSLSSNSSELIYSPNNGTSSYSQTSSFSNYSINSQYALSSSYANNSKIAVTASSISTNYTLPYSDTTLLSTSSLTSSISEKSNYINYSINNGTIYHSIYSDKSAYSDFVNNLDINNNVTMTAAQSSSYSLNSISSSYAQSSSYSYHTKYAKNLLSGEAFSYVTFVTTGSTFDTLKIGVKNWYNINSITALQVTTPYPGIEFTINYVNPIPPGNYVNVKADSSPINANVDLTGDNIPSVLSDMCNGAGVMRRVAISCWAMPCSSTVSKIMVYGIEYKDWDKESLHIRFNYVDPSTMLHNVMFSLIAVTVVTSGSLESPPTTLPLKC
jgi:hypothetical protein